MSSVLQRIKDNQFHLYKGGGIGSVLGTVGGGVAGAVLGGPMGAVAGASIGGALGGAIDGPKKDPMAQAYKAQASAGNAQAAAAIETAKIQGNAAKYAADKQFAAMELQTAAATKAAQTGAMAGIIGSALGAHTTTEQIKQWTPTEAGSQTIQSWDLAQRWNKTLNMRKEGYQDVAINYQLNNKHWSSLFSDSQWNALKMIEMTKKDMMASAQTFGIKSASNPYGVDMDEKGFMELMSYKNPNDMLQVDPAVAQARNQQYNQWKQEMEAQGKGLVVDLFENPQLAGSSILTMKGKDPMLDPALAGLMKTMAPELGSGASIYEQQEAYGNSKADVEQGVRDGLLRRNSKGMIENVPGKEWKPVGKWDKAINALTKGEQNEYTDQIKELMAQGVIDKYGMINAGALNKFIPPELLEAPQFSPFRELDPNEQARYSDMFKSLSEVKVDPKYIREETLGNGLTRKTKLNADGTVSTQAIEGQMIDMTGQSHYVSMQGRGMQDWNDRQMMLSGNPFRPGMRAATNVNAYTQEVFGVGGQMGPSNKLAQPNQGNKGSQASPMNATPSNTSLTNTTTGNQNNTAQIQQTQSQTPPGYSGASLTSGE